MIIKKAELERFIRESNALEGVYDEVSLDRAIAAFKSLIRRTYISQGGILKIHKIMMSCSGLPTYLVGEYRDHNVRVGNDTDLCDKDSINQRMEDWCDEINEAICNGKKLNEKLLHVEFEKIHPFADGNGRVGRMLLNWMRVIRGDSLMIIDRNDSDYYSWFKGDMAKSVKKKWKEIDDDRRNRRSYSLSSRMMDYSPCGCAVCRNGRGEMISESDARELMARGIVVSPERIVHISEDVLSVPEIIEMSVENLREASLREGYYIEGNGILEITPETQSNEIRPGRVVSVEVGDVYQFPSTYPF